MVAARTLALQNRTRLPNVIRLRVFVYELPPWLYVPGFSGAHRTRFFPPRPAPSRAAFAHIAPRPPIPTPPAPDGWDFPQGLHAGGNGMYTADMRFENRLLRDWRVRTLDPFEANLFYLPARNYGWTSNGGDPNVRRARPCC